MSNEKEAIKGCPFCGQDAEMTETHDGNFYLKCSYCFTKSHFWGTEAMAIKYWNERREQPDNAIADALNNIAESLRDFYGNVTVSKNWVDEEQ